MRKVLRKRSNSFLSELDRVCYIQKRTEVLEVEIKKYEGQGRDRFFLEVQSQLLHFSAELNELRRLFKKNSKNVDVVESVLSDVQKCLSALTEKVEQQKNDTNNKPLLRRSKKNSIAPSIMKIAIEVSNLEADINDVKKMQNFDFIENIENRISDICSELDKIKPLEGSASYKTKEDIYVTLIKCMQKLKKSQKMLKDNRKAIPEDILRALDENEKKISNCSSLEDYRVIKNELDAIVAKIRDSDDKRKEAFLKKAHALLEKIDKNTGANFDKKQTRIFEIPTGSFEDVTNHHVNSPKRNDSKSEKKEEMRKIIIEVKRLKRMINCFTGFYGNDEYHHIRSKLKDCSNELSNVNSEDSRKIKSAKKQLESKISGLISRLEEKAIKL